MATNKGDYSMKVTLYVRQEDEAAFTAISNRAAWLHRSLQNGEPAPQVHGNLTDNPMIY